MARILRATAGREGHAPGELNPPSAGSRPPSGAVSSTLPDTSVPHLARAPARLYCLYEPKAAATLNDLDESVLRGLCQLDELMGG